VAVAPPPVSSCPLCSAPLAADQAWCLDCGAAARTRIVPTPPRWPLFGAIIVLAALLALAAIAVAVARLAG
jgi:predicted nucleic acid-binding Zn ribbon protein